MQLSKRIHQVNDSYMKELKARWFSENHKLVAYNEFVPIADEWFKSSKLNTLDGWNEFDCQYENLLSIWYVTSNAGSRLLLSFPAQCVGIFSMFDVFDNNLWVHVKFLKKHVQLYPLGIR